MSYSAWPYFNPTPNLNLTTVRIGPQTKVWLLLFMWSSVYLNNDTLCRICILKMFDLFLYLVSGFIRVVLCQGMLEGSYLWVERKWTSPQNHNKWGMLIFLSYGCVGENLVDTLNVVFVN